MSKKYHPDSSGTADQFQAFSNLRDKLVQSIE